jgi:hypothetical protein
MLRGWRAQQTARGLKDDTIDPRERLVRRFLEFTNEYPWGWSPGHMDEWSLQLTAEEHLAPSMIRSYRCSRAHLAGAPAELPHRGLRPAV